MSVRVLIADDQALVRAGFKMILDAEETSTSSARPSTACRPSSCAAA
jgi:DNA-binding NarL/FixJ family response regulator